jgi:hypothetical protein
MSTVGDAAAPAGVEDANDVTRGVKVAEGLGEREAVGVVVDTGASTKVEVIVGVGEPVRVGVGVEVRVKAALGVIISGSLNNWANSTDADCSSAIARALSYWSSRNPKMPIAARPSTAVSTTMRSGKVRFFIERATV